MEWVNVAGTMPTPPSMQPMALDTSGLNAPQIEAVQHTEGPLLVLAGAGTGKTRVLTTRIAYILAQGLAFPTNILAVTFTNKAAKEMRERVTNLVGPQSSSLWLGTFHSLSLRMLRAHADLISYPKDFSVIDADDQIRLLKTMIKEQHIDDKKYPAKMVANTISRWKDQALSPQQVMDRYGAGVETTLYDTYQKRLETLGVMDFGDLLMRCIQLFREQPEALQRYQNQFKYILVDEYQDTNSSQYLWLRMLAESHHNIACVGDEDQAIYGWRGAEIGHILKFEADFTRDDVSVKTVRLEQNYRSTPAILGAAASVIANNTERLGKTLFCDAEDADPVKVVSLWDDRTEAAYTVQEIEAFQTLRGGSLDQVAILIRAGHQTRSFEEACIAAHIPYRVIGGLRFYERREIKDAISYMRVVAQPTNDLALERIINTPKRGIGGATVDKLRAFAREHGISLYRALTEQLHDGTLKGKVANTLSELMALFEQARNDLHSKPYIDVVQNLLEHSGYLSMWRADKSVEAEGRTENLKELFVALEEFESLANFLEHVSLVSDMDSAPDGDMVSIMTMHSAKGLEFDCVFLGGWEEGLFPSQRSMDEKGAKALEEERRLAYVGMTRARKHLFITFASSRFMHGQVVNNLPSRFLDELPEEHIERLNMVGGASHSAPQPSTGFYAKRPPKQPSFQQPAVPTTPMRKHSKFAVSDRVFHQKFGYGKITDIAGEHITVRFEKSSPRTLMADYLEKA